MITVLSWTIKVDEISNDIFKVTLTDKYGRKAEVTDYANDNTIQKDYQDVFEKRRVDIPNSYNGYHADKTKNHTE